MFRDLQETLSRLVSVFRRRKLDKDFDEEFATHIDLLAEQNERRGLSRDEARRQAILQMGGLNETRALHREARGLQPLERLLGLFTAVLRDMVHAGRSLAKARSFTIVCVASLGIGMGTFVALVTFVRGMMEPVRGVNADGLVELLVIPTGSLKVKAGDWAIEQWSYPDFTELRHADIGVAITGWAVGESKTGTQTSGGAAPARVPTMFVSANYFSTIGVSLSRGAGFDPAIDDAQSGAPRVVLGHDFWQNVLGGDADIIGKTITLDDVSHVVVGIAPEGYRGHLDSDAAPSVQLFLPLERHPGLRGDKTVRFNRDVDWVHIYGRLLPGIDIARANAAVSVVMSRLAERYPASNEFKAASVERYWVRGARVHPQNNRVRTWVLGLSGIVLLLVCLNICGMMLVRGVMRERELSIRQAVGAGRRRLIQYLLSEAVLLSFMAGALSVSVLFGIPAAVAWWLGVPVPPEIDLDATGIAISVSLCLTVAVLFGLLPAVRFSRPNLISALKDEAGGGGRRVGRVHRFAAITQLGLAIPFLIISGLLLDRVRTTDFGFETDGLVAARLDPVAAGSKRGGATLFLQSVRDNLKQVNGINSISMADGMPIDFERRNVRATRPNGEEFVTVHTTRVDERYLETLGTPLLRGRSVTLEDRVSAAHVVVISESLATRLFPDGDAIDQRLRFALEGDREQEFTIVGVSADFATSQLTTARLQILLPLPEPPASGVFLIARGAPGDESMLTSALERTIHDFDPDFVPSRILTGKQLVERSIVDLIAESAAVGGTGSVVLVLAALGISGVIGFMVATRTREIAVRVALGATRSRVLGLLLSDVVKIVMPGVVGGLLLAVVLIRTVLSSFLFGAVESLVYIIAAAIAVLVALLAALPSARRAASVEPMAAIRSE